MKNQIRYKILGASSIFFGITAISFIIDKIIGLGAMFVFGFDMPFVLTLIIGIPALVGGILMILSKNKFLAFVCVSIPLIVLGIDILISTYTS